MRKNGTPGIVNITALTFLMYAERYPSKPSGEGLDWRAAILERVVKLEARLAFRRKEDGNFVRWRSAGAPVRNGREQVALHCCQHYRARKVRAGLGRRVQAYPRRLGITHHAHDAVVPTIFAAT